MKRNTTITVIVLIVLLAIGGFVYFRNAYFPKYRWNIDYRKSSEQPYGLSMFYEAIKEQDHKTTLVYNRSYWNLDTNTTSSNFIYVGQSFPNDSATASWLLTFIGRGNRALIASDDAPLELLEALAAAHDTVHTYVSTRVSAATIQFDTGSMFREPLHFNFQQYKDTALLYSWTGYSAAYLTDTLGLSARPLATLNTTLLTAFQVPYGNGSLIVHANPITLTNYHFARQAGYRHAANLLSLLHDGDTYWDDPSASTGFTKQARRNPLKFLFSHPHLRWAWYLFLVTILLYIVFRSKREQRIIPLMPLNTNSSLGHAKAVGTLYFKHGGQRQIASEMHTLFLADLRARYKVSTDIPEKELVEQVAARSGVAVHLVQDLFRQLNYARKAETVTGDDLVNLHRSIEKFNKRRK